MLAELIGIAVVGGMIVGPLVWRVHRDHVNERAQAVRAQAHAALFRALGGESLVSVQVEAPWLWRAGRVVLSAPSDWASLLEPAWANVVEHVPAGYELVLKPVAPAAFPPVHQEDLALRRAA
jgi:hypothetical protein